MKEKVVWLRDPREIIYDEARFALLAGLRGRAEQIGQALGPGWSVHGSLARGDVKRTSDIDIVFLGDCRSYAVELGLQRAQMEWTTREVVMATPNSTPKGHIHLDENVTVTFPLLGFRPQEEAFYRFGGMLACEGLGRAGRVPGVNKKLLLIIPTEKGHSESSIVGREAETARLLGISVDTVEERVRVLGRRDRVGRTGVYMREQVPESSTFEETLKHFSDRDPAVRRAFGPRGR